MNPARVSVRFPTSNPPGDLEPAIAVFHRFIQRGLVEGLILDVADYRHVPQGPGVMLIGHDVDYGINPDEFTVIRKRSGDDPAATQLRDALRMALGAMDAVEDDGELDVTFDRSRFTIAAIDRRLGTPDEVQAALRVEIEPLITELYGPDAKVSVTDTDGAHRTPTLQVEADPAAAAEVLDRLGGAAAPGQSPWDLRPEELARLRDGDDEFVLVDVREETEYETVNLGGRLIPLATLGDRLDELDRDSHIVVHCRAGGRGAKAVGLLRDAGFDNAWNLNGGLMAWIDRVDPTLPRY